MSQCHDEYKFFLKSLGENIRKAREGKDLTQDMLASELQSSPKYVGCIERAEKNVSLKFLFRMAKTLDKTIEDLCNFRSKH